MDLETLKNLSEYGIVLAILIPIVWRLWTRNEYLQDKILEITSESINAQLKVNNVLEQLKERIKP